MAGGRERIFSTIPVRAIGDDRLSALDLRALVAISIFDGMSQIKTNKPGCYASAATLAAMLKVDITSFSRSLSRLAKLGYILRERQQSDRRRQTLRVIFIEDDSWQSGQLSGAELVDDADNDPPAMVDGSANYSGEIVDIAKSETRRKPPETQPQYIPLSGEIDPNESVEINPAEAARSGSARHGGDDIIDCVWPSTSPAERSRNGVKIDSAKAGLGRGRLIADALPRGLSDDAWLCRIEKGLQSIDYRVDQWNQQERVRVEARLLILADDFAGEQTGHHAERIISEIEVRAAA